MWDRVLAELAEIRRIAEQTDDALGRILEDEREAA